MQTVNIDSIVIGEGRRPVRSLDMLCRSIAEIGLLNPVTITEARLLVAGRNRIAACRQLGWQEIPANMVTLDDVDRQIAEIDENLIRNELTVLERSEHLARRKDLYEVKHPETKVGGDRRSEDARSKGNDFHLIQSFAADAAAKTSVTPRTIRQEVQSAQDIHADVKEQLRQTPTADSKTELLKLARMPEPEQRAVAEKLSSGAAKNVKEAERAIRKAGIVEKINREPSALPAGPYRVIAIDPPWRYSARAGDATHRAGNPYPDMALDEIKALPIAKLAHEDCIVWLWTTNAFLKEAFECLESWGFESKTMLSWVKDRIGMGNWLRGQTEHCLMAVRGKPVVVLTNQSTALSAPMREHSRKPDEFYAMVDALCPGNKLEMFAREPRSGWHCWGAEVTLFAA